jgi:hypothetical protein
MTEEHFNVALPDGKVALVTGAGDGLREEMVRYSRWRVLRS